MLKPLVAILVWLMLAAAARAQTFPQKPVRLIVPFAAGSATDTVIRLLAQGLSERMKATFVVENKAGASGVIGASYVAKATPDGHTLLMATTSTHSQNPWMLKTLPYDPIKDYTPIAGIGGFPFVLVVNPSLPVTTVKELIAFAKARPGQLTYGTPHGTATVCAETLRIRTGIDISGVPYKSSPQAVAELIAGQITMICSDFSTAITNVRAGKIRAIAVTTDNRSAQLPDVPTLKETFSDFVELRSWIGVLAPAAAPREMVDLLSKEILAVISVPEFKARLAIFGFESLQLNPDQLSGFMRDELAKWGKLIKQAGIEPQ